LNLGDYIGRGVSSAPAHRRGIDMAYIMNLGNETDIKWIFNVSFPVGPGCSNRPDDVQLVQHGINAIMAHLELFDDGGRPITSYLKRDGHFGPRTSAAIKAYQRNLKARRRVVAADGRIDPSSRTGWTSHTQDQYTIVHLNRDHRNCHGRMMREADFPEPLRTIVDTAPRVG